MKYVFHITFIASLILILTGLANESSAQSPKFEVSYHFHPEFEFPIGYDVKLTVEVQGEYGDDVYVRFEANPGKLELVSGREIERHSESILRARPDSLGRITVFLTFTHVGETKLNITLRTSATEYQTRDVILRAVPLAAKWKKVDVSSSLQHESSKNYDVHFTDTQRGLIVSNENILDTSDGRRFNGSRPLASILPPGVSRERLRIYQVEPRSLLFFLFGENLLLRHTEAGYERVTITEEQRPDTQDVSIADMWFANEREGIAVGPSGIFRTSDGGRTWTLRRLRVTDFHDDESAKRHLSGHLTCLYFIDRNTGWVAGTTGILFRIAFDGPIVDLLDNITFVRLHFIDSLRGWAINAGGVLFKTEDGGKTWQDVSYERRGHISLEDISFADARYICAVGSDIGTPVILQTTDSGKSWTRIPFGMSGTFHAVQCIKPNNIWVVGSNNSVFRFSFPYIQSEKEQYE